MSKLVILAVGAAGYVLGAKAGRERYDQISAGAQKFWSDPRVQRAANEAKGKAQEKAPEAREKLNDVVSSVSDKVSGSSTTT